MEVIEDIVEKASEILGAAGLDEVSSPNPPPKVDGVVPEPASEIEDEASQNLVELHQDGGTNDLPIIDPSTPESLFEDPVDEDDDEGEWITTSNVAVHKSRALNLLPADKKSDKANKPIHTGCMTADFAMQNVLLQMGLDLVSVDGQRIEKVKSWILRCHACFKYTSGPLEYVFPLTRANRLCKDNSKKFCPSCGNPTLLRVSVTSTSPNASRGAPAMIVHLKKNFQYRTRGTIYSIPSPKPGSAKGGPGDGLILREDQAEWIRATKRAEGMRVKEEARLVKGLSTKRGLEQGAVVSSWMDPDWVPEIISVGAGGKGRSPKGRDGDMPAIGYGRRNPNERRKK